jgi:hypothetical protein
MSEGTPQQNPERYREASNRPEISPRLPWGEKNSAAARQDASNDSLRRE